MLNIEIDGLPPSYNKHFQIIWNLREICLTPEAHLFKNRVMMKIPPIEIEQKPLQIEIEYHSNWHTKDGKNKKQDLQNLDKLLIDAIFKKLGIDDSLIWKMVASKVQDERVYTKVRLDYVL